MTYAELSFQFAKEIATQLITLSSALIGVSVTFVKDFKSDNLRPLRASWGFYILTIICGVWTLMTLTGTLEGLSESNKAFTSFAWSTRIAASAQIVSFIAATIFLVVFGWKHALERHTTTPVTTPITDPAAATLAESDPVKTDPTSKPSGT